MNTAQCSKTSPSLRSCTARLALEEICTIIKTGTVDALLSALYRQKEALNNEIMEMQDLVKDMEWYISRFTYMDEDNTKEAFYTTWQEERHVLEVPCYESDALSDMEIRLAAAKGMTQYKDLPFRRQYGYKLQFDALAAGRFQPYSYFLHMRKKPDFQAEHFRVLPAGEYLCFRTRLLLESWDTRLLNERFRLAAPPRLVIALEFEDNLVDWSDAMYEIQMLL